jgi:hypothetical protein
MTYKADMERMQKTLYRNKDGIVDRVTKLETAFEIEMKNLNTELKRTRVPMYWIVGFLIEISLVLTGVAFKIITTSSL